MIRRETDAKLLNRIAAEPDVRAYMRPDRGPINFARVETASPEEMGGVVLSNGKDAAAIFETTAPGIYQSHTMFGPTCRGRRAIETARDMVAWMFDHGACIVWGSTPRTNRKAIWFNRQIGASELSTSDADDAIYEIRRERWAR